MSLSTLISGADCGPVNPLQALSKRLDTDRGAQQDQFGPRAGSSRDAFRTQQPTQPGFSNEAASFFSTHGIAPTQVAPSPLDLSALRGSIDAIHNARSAALHASAALSPAWAADFMMAQSPLHMTPSESHPGLEKLTGQGQLSRAGSSASQWRAELDQLTQAPPRSQTLPQNSTTFYHSPPLPQFGQYNAPYLASPVQNLQWSQAQPQATVDASWASHFARVDSELAKPSVSAPATASVLVSEQLNAEAQDARAADAPHASDLATTAGLLIDAVKSDKENPKFANSEFMRLMHQLRDREVVVQGNDMVDLGAGAAWAQQFKVSEEGKGKGKGKEKDMSGWAQDFTGASSAATATKQEARLSADLPSTLRSFGQLPQNHLGPQVHALLPHTDTSVRQEGTQGAETSLGWEHESTLLAESYGEQRQIADPTQPDLVHPQAREWDKLQEDWDAWEATSTGMRAVSPEDKYTFQPNNPYLAREGRFGTRHHDMHDSARLATYESLLEKEAEAYRNPTDPGAWYELGVKQQENEREDKAIAALTRAISLDPTHLPSWLALAVSRSNEGSRGGAVDAIREWVERNSTYTAEIAAWRRAQTAEEMTTSGSVGERSRALVDCLMAMARKASSGEVDADIQIALAVLLHSSEEYEKAQDCFRTALAVRPDDWLLYNRVGATLANSGHPDQALEYYYSALELNPGYIRARFNLGISCISLRKFSEAAQHLLDALVLQEGDATEYPPEAGAPGVTSSALWETLKTACLHLQRLDLAALCEHQNLEGFRTEFQMI
ncbi:hypothetical protein BOTBODRAFT_49936 [Botryobasidium botryosum FD-172 SS1]|uniref:Uncharacterized protein n=1 Tax=Botryobasidium botryosum (strain FD-172 SS1) TaxID=930990 RepID=A0A067N091_BOTB1|nr:hypothetical protein BOTBODRAFT_49936 [Botryobasidium botryosum FD-172 SS1]